MLHAMRLFSSRSQKTSIANVLRISVTHSAIASLFRFFDILRHLWRTATWNLFLKNTENLFLFLLENTAKKEGESTYFFWSSKYKFSLIAPSLHH